MESFQNLYLVVRCVYNAWKAALDTGSGFGSLREPTLELNFTNPYCTFSRPNKTLFWKNMSNLMIIWKWLCSLGWVFFYRFLCENLLGLHLVIFYAYVEDIMQNILSVMFAVSCWWLCWWSKFFILLLFFLLFFFSMWHYLPLPFHLLQPLAFCFYSLREGLTCSKYFTCISGQKSGGNNIIIIIISFWRFFFLSHGLA